MACITLSNIDSNLTCSEQDNMGGLVPKLIYGYYDEVATWPEFPEPTESSSILTLSLENAGALVGSIVMATGKRAFTLEFTEDTGSFTVAPQGDAGSLSFLYTLTFINKRIRKKIFGFMNAAKNRKMFFIVQDSNGVYYLMGDKFRGARLTSGDGAVTGAAATDANQTTMVFTYTSPRALVYEGDTDDLLTPASST